MTFSTIKDPQADLDYQIDWTAWLGTDTITASTWTAPTVSSITLHAGSIDGPGKKTTTWMSGGTLNSAPYQVVNHITTAAGRIDDRSIMVTIQQK